MMFLIPVSYCYLVCRICVWYLITNLSNVWFCLSTKKCISCFLG